jgi:23S rRNA (guanosine2251-2'-O)-methyltransferase
MMIPIYGVHPIIEALEHGGHTIEKIIITTGRHGNDIQKILTSAARHKIPVLYENREYMDKIVHHKNHQGVIGLSGAFQYITVEHIIASLGTPRRGALVMILDCIEDPQNLGSLIRTGHCFGVNGIIIPEDRTASVTPAVIKASAGAALHTPIARVVNISKAIDYLQSEGFWIYGTDAAQGSPCNTFDYADNIGLVLGSEQKGMRPLIKKKCDFLVSIPMAGRIDSLNVSVAAGILMYQIASQQQQKG